jgi:site-specific recombinase
MSIILSAKQKKNTDFIQSVTRRSTVLHIGDKKAGLEFLINFFSAVRPQGSKEKKEPARNFQTLLLLVDSHPILTANLRNAILSQIIQSDLTTALTESGIPLANGFWQEFFGRIRHKFIPTLRNENNFLYTLNSVFFKSNDFTWIEEIPHELWKNFFVLLELEISVADKHILIQLIQSLRILSMQTANLGLEKQVRQYLQTQDIDENPFLNQNIIVQEIEKSLRTEQNLNFEGLCLRLHEVTKQGIESIEYIRQGHANTGTSIHQTYILLILSNKLNRIDLIIQILNDDTNFNSGNFISFFKTLVKNENTKNSIRQFLSESLGYLAYQIAEHKGSRGSHYITTNKKEYSKMIWSAMKGGAVTSIIAVFKCLITDLELPLFWHGFAYSMNYSIGFLLIDGTGGTLATKQPAFTASAVASSLDTKGNTYKPNLYNLAITVARVSRSQIASFIGNLLIVYPGAFGIAWLYHLVMHKKILEGKAAITMLESQHPWHSLSLLYACNTGVFLFFSGIIAGYIQNKIRFGQIGDRLKSHPWWRTNSTPEKKLARSTFIEKNAGTIIGNIALGFMLGMSSMVGKFLGFPFDIRHITISAGNVAVSLYGIGIQNVHLSYLVTIFCGVFAIGLINFLVSFSLAFLVAVKSRGVQLKDYPEFLGILWRYFIKKPLDFIRPRNSHSGAE